MDLDYEKAGQSGDMFGSLNTLFSGLAFAGFLLALWMQRQDLNLQRQEMQNTRKEMEAQTRLHREELIAAAWNEVRIRASELQKGFKEKAIQADDLLLCVASMLDEGMRQCCSPDSAKIWFYSIPKGFNCLRTIYLNALRDSLAELFCWIEPISNYVIKAHLLKDDEANMNLCEHRLRSFVQGFSEREYRVFCLCLLYAHTADKLSEESDFSSESCYSQLGLSDYATYVIDKIVIKEEAIDLSFEKIASEAHKHLKTGEQPETPDDNRPKDMVFPECKVSVSAG